MRVPTACFGVGVRLDSTGRTRFTVDPANLHNAKLSVGFLYAEELNAKGVLVPKPVGTSFVVGQVRPTVALYLVTAKHVYNDLLGSHGRMFVRLNRMGPGVEYLELPEEGWLPHPDPNVDLIVIPWLPVLKTSSTKPSATVQALALSLDEGDASREYAASIGKPWPPEEGEQVFFVGLMLQHQGEERNLPIVRMGHIALNTDELIDLKGGRSQYRIIESQAYKETAERPSG